MKSEQILEAIAAQALQVGDRVSIRRDRWPLLGHIDQVGTIVELLHMPRDSCLVRVDGDILRNRAWFFYNVEVLADDV